MRVRVAIVTACLLLLAATALAWSPGPYELRRMAVEADVIVVGKVASVEVVSRRGRAETARAVVKVETWILGGPTPERAVNVLFNRKVDDDLELPVAMAAGERVLLFLRSRTEWLPLGAALAEAPPPKAGGPDYVVQFAKARNVGYKLTVGPGDVLAGFMDDKDPRKLSEAIAVVDAHRPSRVVGGMRASLWMHDVSLGVSETPLPVVTIRNVGPAAIRVDLYPTTGLLTLELLAPDGTVLDTFVPFADLAREKRAGPTEADIVTLKPGDHHTWEPTGWKVPGAVRAKASRVRARFTVVPRTPGGAVGWTDTIATNELAIDFE